ncbi:MAG: DUF4468 domain-containing protein [Bacteroidales bacterium]|nr:DUF4468 domain-containing protein [Bacteroidales bacterium]
MNKIIKISIITLFVIISTNAFSQNTYDFPIDETTGKIHYKEVVTVEGIKNDLYIRAQKWLHVFFRNASSAIRKLDQENGIIEGRRVFKTVVKDKKGKEKPSGNIKYTFRIEVKDGRYRVRLFDFVQATTGSKPLEIWFEDTDEEAIKIHAQIFQQVKEDVEKLIASLKKGMRPKVIEVDEW